MDIETSNRIVQDKWSSMEVTSSKRRGFGFESSNGNQDAINSSNIVQGPSLTELQRKFLALDDNIGSITNNRANDNDFDSSDDDIDVRLIKPKDTLASDASNPSKERTVIISGNRGLTGAQG